MSFNTGDTKDKPKLFIVSHFLPVTLTYENSRSFPHFPPRAVPEVKTDSLAATAPPSRYHYRSDSDPGKMPYSPRPSILHSPTSKSSRSPRSTLQISPTEWSIEPSNMGNIGLFNAVSAMNDSKEYQHDKMFIGQLGIPVDILSDAKKQEISKDLFTESKSIPVFVKDCQAQGHYTHFCKEILWPTVHYISPDYLKASANEKTAWNHYVAVNLKFADTVCDHYKEGDLIWIHDYHLFLVPKMIRKRLPNAKIGFFLHVPFPSSEVFRWLYVRKELLEGLLGSDLIGFQTYPFARHFLQTTSKILGLQSNPKGIIISEEKSLPVGIFPIGIDTPTLNIKRQEQEVLEMINMLTEKYQGKKVIVARDKLDPVKGVRQKLLAFEIFLTKYPEFQGRVVLVQVALLTKEHLDLQRQVSDLVGRINSKFGSIEYTPVVYLHQDISYSHYLALLTIADACLITSLRDGMNLTSHEYVACQEDRHSPLILSEFTGTYGSFGSAIRVNPWDYNEVANSIYEALTMSDETKTRNHQELYKHVVSNTGAYWAEGFVAALINELAVPAIH